MTRNDHKCLIDSIASWGGNVSPAFGWKLFNFLITLSSVNSQMFIGIDSFLLQVWVLSAVNSIIVFIFDVFI